MKLLSAAAILGLIAIGTAGSVSAATPTWTGDSTINTAVGNLGSTTAPCVGALSTNCIYEVGGRSETNNGLTTTAMYIAKSKTWSTEAALKTGRSDAGTATAPCTADTTRSCIYEIGGTNAAGTFLTSVEEYDPSTNAWSTLTGALPTPGAPSNFLGRSQLAAISARCFTNTSQTCVYAIGGYNPALYTLASVEQFNPSTKTWTAAASLNTARSKLAVATASCVGSTSRTCIYAVGGTGTNGFISSVEMYSPKTNTWTVQAPLQTNGSSGTPDPIQALGTATAPCVGATSVDCIFAYGGLDSHFNVLSSTMMFNPTTNSWTILPESMDTSRDSFGAAAGPCSHAAGKCLYAVGGSGQDFTNDVEEFSP